MGIKEKIMEIKEKMNQDGYTKLFDCEKEDMDAQLNQYLSVNSLKLHKCPKCGHEFD